MRLDIVPGSECLADIGQVAHDRADAARLTGFKLCRDEHEGRGLSYLPFDFSPEADSELTGDAYPVGVAQNPVGLAVLDRAVNRCGDAQGGCVFRIARIVGAVRLDRGEDFVFDVCCNHILTVL